MCEPNKSGHPMSFLHLDMLSDLLMRDLQELESDFDNKVQFCKEQEQTVVDNLKNLLSVDQVVGSLKCCMLGVEMDLNQNETNLIEAEKAVSRLERNCQRAEHGPPSRVYPLARATYEDLLEQLLATEKIAVKCNNVRGEIEAFHQEAVEKLMPRNVITKIINYHTSTLESMQKQINQMESQVRQVQSEYEKLKGEMEAKKSPAKCPCNLLAGIEPMDICEI